MIRTHLVVALVIGSCALLSARSASAHARGVGLGVAAGVAYSGTKVTLSETRDAIGARAAWGFFVDIPLLSTFYITPAAMLYEIDMGDGKVSATDVDLNFKFIVPIGPLRIGGGVLGGLTTGLGDYRAHYGISGYGAFNAVANLDFFVLAQYKRLVDPSLPVDDLHGFAGAMFRF